MILVSVSLAYFTFAVSVPDVACVRYAPHAGDPRFVSCILVFCNVFAAIKDCFNPRI